MTRSIPDAARAARLTMRALPGFRTSFSMGSALFLAAAPDRMAVYDKWADRSLDRLGIKYRGTEGYGRYMEIVVGLVEQANSAGQAWNPRDVDLALYWYGKDAGRDAVKPRAS